MKGVVTIGLFRRKKKQEIRADTQEQTETSLLTFFSSDDSLTREQTIEIPTVSACISKIGETISRLPVKLYRKNGEEINEITDDPRLHILNGETGDTLSTAEMWRAAIEDYYLGRGAWLYIDSNGINFRGLHYVDSRNVSIFSNTDPIFKAFRVQINGQMYYDFRFLKLLRKTRDGWNNIPIQSESKAVLAAAYNALRLENMMNSNGGSKSGFLKSKGRLTKEAIQEIRDGYQRVYDNKSGKDKIVVLNEGVDFQEITSTAAELQLNENKKTNSIEVCKLFGFPHTVIDGGATEDDNKKFVSAVIAILDQIETELDRNMLLEAEKAAGYYWAFDTKELTRGSQLERMQAYEIAKRSNIMQIDEIRREEDLKPLGFNFVTLGLSDVLVDPATMEVFTPNTGQSKNLLTGEERAAELRGRIPIRGDHGQFNGSISDGMSGGSSRSGFSSEKRLYSNGGSSGKSAKSVDKSGESDIIDNKECEIHPDKVQKFFLQPGAKHSKDFFDVGYTEKDAKRLTNDLTACFDYSKAVDRTISTKGIEKFSIFAELGINKKKRFRTVWQKDTPESAPRIITAHREDG